MDKRQKDDLYEKQQAKENKPNLAKSYVTVQDLATDATANISIKDGSGTVLTRGTSNGSTQYRSSVSNLLPGTYYLNITTAGKTETLPFVKE